MPFNNLKKLFKLNLNKQSTKPCHSIELNSESQLFEKKTKKPEGVRESNSYCDDDKFKLYRIKLQTDHTCVIVV